MLDKIYKEVSELFEQYGDPKQNPMKYMTTFNGLRFSDYESLYPTYKRGSLKQHLAINPNIMKAIVLEYNGNIKSIIDHINAKKENIDTIFISNNIDNLEDLNLLKESFPNKNILVNFEEELAFIDDAIDSKYMIDYFKSIIDDDLSPLEKVTIAYDIVKSHKYEDTDSLESRNITQMVHNTKIVCTGYISILKKILKDLGFKPYSLILNYKQGEQKIGHERLMMDLEDPKYDIHAAYIFDPTFDSTDPIYVKINEDNAERSNIKQDGFKEVDALSKYNYFLIPFEQYENKFKNSCDEVLIVDNKEFDKDLLHSFLHEDQEDYEDNELFVIDFINLLNVVKKREGYPKEMIPDLIQEALFINKYGFYKKDDIMNNIEINNEQIR